jgi:hypothetical protein
LTGTVRSAGLLVLIAAGGLAVSGCGGTRPNGAAFCAHLGQDQAVLSAGITGQADIDAALERYEALGKLAPAAIREPWQQLTSVLQQAALLDPGDPTAAATLRQLAFESQTSADQVSDWARATCGIDLRPPSSIVPTGAASGATTAPATPSTSGG